ncbi:hypothetical protein EB796_014766 [Bugula neritina]|uniref:Uncharacterized protein n=1 Tax=Bugula neritina TaxID=10212 RepID=A0A7J7JMR2_BUGNE|nr:hypothetical protein EB796_014766 [Bugula neritina]
MPKRTVVLGYDSSHFFHFFEQLASRLEDHQTTGNQICHLIAAPILGMAFFSLLNMVVGSTCAVSGLVMLMLWSLINDIFSGVFYTLYSIVGTVLQLNYGFGPQTLTSTLLLSLLAIFIQLGVGHGFFERRPPNELEGVVKGEGKLFAILDLLCELVPATFHFYTILFMRLGFRPDLDKLVQAELYRIQNIISER